MLFGTAWVLIRLPGVSFGTVPIIFFGLAQVSIGSANFYLEPLRFEFGYRCFMLDWSDFNWVTPIAFGI